MNMKTISPILGELLEKIYQNKKITTRQMDFSSRNLWIKVARDHDLVKVDSLGERNEFIYVLTPKGTRVAELWIELKPLLNGSMKKEQVKMKNVRDALNN